MKIFITGGSGYLGNSLAHTLADMGNEIHTIVRSASATKLLQHPNITVFPGDIRDKQSLLNAMKGCQQVYHTAAMVGVRAKDPDAFYDVNVKGTLNVLDAALQTGVKKFVFTSTCGVIGPSLYEPKGENDPRITRYELDYDLSKKMGEDLVLQYSKKGMDVVIVSPSKVYGPGNISHSFTANAVIDKFLKKGIVFIPSPGDYKVCFAFIDDIVKGHLLAMEKGRSGEKYILGGINISYKEFFDQIRTISSRRGRIIKLSKNIIKVWALSQKVNSKITGRQPRFTTKSIDYIFRNYIFSSEKAIRELGYSITPLEEALKQAIHYLFNNNLPDKIKYAG